MLKHGRLNRSFYSSSSVVSLLSIVLYCPFSFAHMFRSVLSVGLCGQGLVFHLFRCFYGAHFHLPPVSLLVLCYLENESCLVLLLIYLILCKEEGNIEFTMLMRIKMVGIGCYAVVSTILYGWVSFVFSSF